MFKMGVEIAVGLAIVAIIVAIIVFKPKTIKKRSGPITIVAWPHNGGTGFMIYYKKSPILHEDSFPDLWKDVPFSVATLRQYTKGHLPMVRTYLTEVINMERPKIEKVIKGLQ